MRYIIIIILSAMSMKGSCQDPENGLILHYKFDGNFLDATNNHFDGTGNATLGEDHLGNPDRAAHFNGINQYINFPVDNAILEPDLPVSYALWIRFELPSPFVTLIFTSDYAQDIHTGSWISTTYSGTLNCGYGDGTGNAPNNRRSFESDFIMETNTWYHIVAVIREKYDMSLYVDCQRLDGYYAGQGGDMVYTSNPGSLGRKDTGPNNPVMYFWGSIDDFRYYNRALTYDDIDSLCNMKDPGENPPEPECNLVLYPNPAEDIINIKCLPDSVTRIEMSDVIGKLLRIFDRTEQIPIETLPPDAYFLTFKDNHLNIIARKKFIKYYKY